MKMATIVLPWRCEGALGPDVSRHWLRRVKDGLDRFGLAAASGKFRSFTKTAFCRGFTLRMLPCLSDFLAPINRQFHACGVFSIKSYFPMWRPSRPLPFCQLGIR